MVARYCRLRQDFVPFLDRSGVRINYSDAEAWIREKYKGIRKGDISKLLNTGYGRAELVPMILRYLLDGTPQATLSPKDVVYEYLRTKCNAPSGTISFETITTHITAPEEADSFIRGSYRVIDFATDQLIPTTARCRESDVRQAIEWVLVDLTRQLTGERLTLNAATKYLGPILNLEVADYLARIEEWMSFDPWTCVLGLKGKLKLGISVILPLKYEAYCEFRNGLRGGLDFSRDDLERPSRYLLIHTASPRENCPSYTRSQVLDKLLVNVIHQVGVLSYSEEIAKLETPLHVMSIGTTPLNIERLESDNYIKQKSKMKGTNVPIYERVLNPCRFRENLKEGLVDCVLKLLGKGSRHLLSPQEQPPGLE